ncbi:hypothetical protein M407DRAFT_84104 [Tulasnella calospora MUT 4182]|uniref:DUF4218 domain-containing protein n=1 Tax=Tulasnella calospora MUT 4182 TaxID=1051891 RepID=A0A0C3KA51_9AGAM|nr:hypothetical protein M407DRAFT_84104 [Tulasnella calospora MUT 4182]
MASKRLDDGGDGGLSPEIPPLPKSLATALAKFDIDPILHYAVQCPTCGAQYPFDQNGGFDTFCSWQDFENSGPCGTALGSEIRVRNRAVRSPKKVLARQNVSEWIARMLARPGMEAAMDRTARAAEVKEVVSDIWDSPFIHSVPWKDGKKFAEAPESQLRLVFTMGIDWFGAHHSPAGKKQWSVGAMYLICLNIPAPIRQRPENICLVLIIPGPQKPSAEQLNHFLKPVVDEFLPFWETGRWYTQTTEFPEGRLVLILLLLLIADLEACRALAGFNHHSHQQFCSYCDITQNTITNLDHSTWKRRDSETHRAQALRWRDANTLEERKMIAAQYGVRFSELLRLPYWDPVRQMVPEPMHIIHLGVAKRHCRSIWKMDLTVQGGDGRGFIISRSTRTVLGTELIQEIKLDRAITILPTGYRKAPEHMGSKSHGKLSADEWRTLLNIHMVVTIPRIWSKEPEGSRLAQMLDNFIHLVTASRLATARIASPDHSKCCLEHMVKYLEGIVKLFPMEPLVPNHHLAVHIPADFLDVIGPIQPWSANIFERLNGILQKIPTNHRFGKFDLYVA